MEKYGFLIIITCGFVKNEGLLRREFYRWRIEEVQEIGHLDPEFPVLCALHHYL